VDSCYWKNSCQVRVESSNNVKKTAIFLEYLVHKYVTRGNVTDTSEIFQRDYLT